MKLRNHREEENNKRRRYVEREREGIRGKIWWAVVLWVHDVCCVVGHTISIDLIAIRPIDGCSISAGYIQVFPFLKTH